MERSDEARREDGLYDQISALNRANRKLERALQEIIITRIMYCDGKSQGDYACDLHVQIAKEALEGGGD